MKVVDFHALTDPLRQQDVIESLADFMGLQRKNLALPMTNQHFNNCTDDLVPPTCETMKDIYKEFDTEMHNTQLYQVLELYNITFTPFDDPCKLIYT